MSSVRARPAELLLAAVVGASVVWVLFLRTVGPSDLDVFVRAGRSVTHGVSPYVDPGSAALWSGHAFVYPYVVAWIFAPLAALSANAADVLYYVASVGALLVTVRLTRGPRPGVLTVLLVVTAEPVVRSLQLGTVNAWLALLLAVAWRYRRQQTVVVLALAGAIVAKLFLLPMLAWVVLSGRIRAGVAATALSAGLIIGGCVAAGQSLQTFTRMLSVLSQHEAAQSSSVTALAEQLGLTHAAAFGVAVVVALLVIAAGWLAMRRTGDEAYLFVACILASLAASPIVWSHYFTLLVLVPLIFGWRTRALVVAWVVTWLVETPVGEPALNVLHPFTGAGWIWGLGLTAVALIVRRRLLSSGAGP